MSINIYLTKLEEIMKPEYLSEYSDGLRTEQPGSIPGRGKKFFFIPQRLDGFLSSEYKDSYPGVKRSAREPDYSPTSSAEVKNGGANPPVLHMSS
jgi:hypothetical protein